MSDNAIAVQDTKQTPLAIGNRGVSLRTFDEAWRFAVAVHRSGLAPKSLKKPESILIALQYGSELGFAPMQALANIADINGKACLYGDGLKALVEASPHCEYVTESLDGKGEGMVATCKAKRVGREEPTVRTFSVDDAKRAGLWGKTGPWVQYPQRMLQMRARSWALRDQFPDLLCGLGVVEEVQDYEEPVTFQSGDAAPQDDLDALADALGDDEPEGEGGPTREELVATGQLEPSGDRLFDDAPVPEPYE